MTDTTDVPDTVHEAITRTLDTWDITVHDQDDISTTHTGENTYEVKVPISGRVLLDDLITDGGLLLHIRDGIEISLKGFEDDRLLLEVIVH